MANSKLTLQSVEQPSGYPARKRYTWHKGSIQPFSSLWIIVVRFALLNRPKFDSLNEDLQGLEAGRLRRTIVFGSDRPWPQHSTIDIRSFAQMLGEPLEAFRWSTIGDFPNGIQDLFSRGTKICPSCMAQGFHTIIFSADCIQRCPHHGDTLLHTCPSCGKWLDDRSKANPGIVPRICGCGREWLSGRLARRPPSDAVRDAAMADVAAWAEKVGHRCWAYVPPRPHIVHELQRDTLHDHIERWRTELGETVPAWLNLSLHSHLADPSLLRCIEHSGIRKSSLARLTNAGRAYLSKVSDPSGQLWNPGIQPFRLFKCIRRYLVKHVLGNRVGLLVWMGKNLSAPNFRNCLRENRYAHVAWAVLHWMQSSQWNEVGARRWFLTLQGISTYPVRHDTNPTGHWGSCVQDHLMVSPGTDAEEWIVNWVNVSAMLDIWPTQQDLELYAADDGFVRATYTRAGRLPVRWWAWLGNDGCLHFGVYRRRPAWWMPPAQRRSKNERCQAFINKEARRLQTLRDAMNAAVIRRHDDGTWQVEGPRNFALGADLRSARLLTGAGPPSRFGVGLDPQPAADPSAPWFVRSLDLPVCVTAADVRSGVLKLKLAVNFYAQHAARSEQP